MARRGMQLQSLNGAMKWKRPATSLFHGCTRLELRIPSSTESFHPSPSRALAKFTPFLPFFSFFFCFTNFSPPRSRSIVSFPIPEKGGGNNWWRKNCSLKINRRIKLGKMNYEMLVFLFEVGIEGISRI